MGNLSSAPSASYVARVCHPEIPPLCAARPQSLQSKPERLHKLLSDIDPKYAKMDSGKACGEVKKLRDRTCTSYEHQRLHPQDRLIDTNMVASLIDPKVLVPRLLASEIQHVGRKSFSQKEWDTIHTNISEDPRTHELELSLKPDPSRTREDKALLELLQEYRYHEQLKKYIKAQIANLLECMRDDVKYQPKWRPQWESVQSQFQHEYLLTPDNKAEPLTTVQDWVALLARVEKQRIQYLLNHSLNPLPKEWNQTNYRKFLQCPSVEATTTPVFTP